MKLWEEDSLQILSFCFRVFRLSYFLVAPTTILIHKPIIQLEESKCRSGSQENPFGLGRHQGNTCGNWCFNDARTYMEGISSKQAFIRHNCLLCTVSFWWRCSDVLYLKNSFEWKGSKIQWFHDKNCQYILHYMYVYTYIYIYIHEFEGPFFPNVICIICNIFSTQPFCDSTRLCFRHWIFLLPNGFKLYVRLQVLFTDSQALGNCWCNSCKLSRLPCESQGIYMPPPRNSRPYQGIVVFYIVVISPPKTHQVGTGTNESHQNLRRSRPSPHCAAGNGACIYHLVGSNSVINNICGGWSMLTISYICFFF